MYAGKDFVCVGTFSITYNWPQIFLKTIEKHLDNTF